MAFFLLHVPVFNLLTFCLGLCINVMRKMSHTFPLRGFEIKVILASHKNKTKQNKKNHIGVPIVAQWKQIRIVSMRMQVWSLALLMWWSGTAMWCRLQMRRQFWVASAVAQSSSWCSSSTPGLGTSICWKCGPEKQKQNCKVSILWRVCICKWYNSFLKCRNNSS